MIYIIVSSCAIMTIVFVKFIKQIRRVEEYTRQLENRCEYLQNLLTGSVTDRIKKQREWHEVLNNRK